MEQKHKQLQQRLTYPQKEKQISVLLPDLQAGVWIAGIMPYFSFEDKRSLPARDAHPAEGSADTARTQGLHQDYLCSTSCSANSARIIKKQTLHTAGQRGDSIILQRRNKSVYFLKINKCYQYSP